jgi:hypothetical protein
MFSLLDLEGYASICRDCFSRSTVLGRCVEYLRGSNHRYRAGFCLQAAGWSP